ncbi:hypothetical protein Cni_G13783 [Canna indica]|uniref:Longin domain-containing protein n=1 Tax=Canna indica TaxID=4628 RepID=A0AAQ3KCP6_9LILI|nr:hypothetical protein Cni_G13783 [Canna indica]
MWEHPKHFLKVLVLKLELILHSLGCGKLVVHAPFDTAGDPNVVGAKRVGQQHVKMVKLTMIARFTDGLPLVEGFDDGRDLKDADFYKQQAKLLFKNLSEVTRKPLRFGGHWLVPRKQPLRKRQEDRRKIDCSVTLLRGARVCYLTMCDRSYPKKLTFQYLEDLKNEYERVNGSQIETAARPYAFIKFDTFIQKTKKLYLDTRTQRNIAKLNDELYEVHQIMTRNVQEVLGVGEKLDRKLPVLLFVYNYSVC